MSKQIETPGEAISVLIQVAQLAQSKGVLSFDDAAITKNAIDFLTALAESQEGPRSAEEVVEG